MQKFRSWKHTLNFMYQQLPMFQRVGAAAYKKDLSNTLKLCEACGNPQHQIKCVHIAGTNGKGTTTHIIASGLQSQDYQVGVYTSPHYVDFRERIKINGLYIPKKYIIDFINTYIEDIKRIQPSFFELTVVLAFRYFVDMGCDVAVIETGLGGRLDSTNVITPLLSVITNISFDHQSMLGDTLPQIASEKAGIIKPFTPVIIGESQEEVKSVFLEKAKEMNAVITFADQCLRLVQCIKTAESVTYDIYYDNDLWINGLKTSLIGPFQDRNIITGLCALRTLSYLLPIDFVKVVENFDDLPNQTAYMGRWQILDHHPLILVDSAHNTGGMQYVVRALKKIKTGKIHIILGFVNDKDITPILKMMPCEATYYFAKANIPRGLEASKLQEQAQIIGLYGKSYSSVRRAFVAAKQKSSEIDTIFVGGSIFIVGEILESYIKHRHHL